MDTDFQDGVERIVSLSYWSAETGHTVHDAGQMETKMEVSLYLSSLLDGDKNGGFCLSLLFLPSWFPQLFFHTVRVCA